MVMHAFCSTVTVQDTIEMKQNEVYGISAAGIETTSSKVYGVSSDDIETTPNVVYGTAFDQ